MKSGKIIRFFFVPLCICATIYHAENLDDPFEQLLAVESLDLAVHASTQDAEESVGHVVVGPSVILRKQKKS